MPFNYEGKWTITKVTLQGPNADIGLTDTKPSASQSSFKVKQKINGDWVIKGQRNMAWSPSQIALVDLWDDPQNDPEPNPRFEGHFILGGNPHTFRLISDSNTDEIDVDVTADGPGGNGTGHGGRG